MSIQQPTPAFQQLDQYKTEIDGEFARGFAVRKETMTEWVESTWVCPLEDWR
jgi:hypothetical protein